MKINNKSYSSTEPGLFIIFIQRKKCNLIGFSRGRFITSFAISLRCCQLSLREARRAEDMQREKIAAMNKAAEDAEMFKGKLTDEIMEWFIDTQKKSIRLSSCYRKQQGHVKSGIINTYGNNLLLMIQCRHNKKIFSLCVVSESL